MKNLMKKAEWLALADVLMLPVFLYAYGRLELLFWIVLILYDSYVLKEVDQKDLRSLLSTDASKSSKRVISFGICYAIALGIVAFKNWQVAVILLVNEVLMTIVAFVNLTKEDEK